MGYPGEQNGRSSHALGAVLRDYRSIRAASFQRINEWTMRANDRLGVGTWGGASRFHKVELIDRTGSSEQ